MNIGNVILIQLIIVTYSYFIIPYTKRLPQTIEDYLFPRYITEVRFGTPMKSFALCINVNSPYTWLIDGHENKNEEPQEQSLNTYNQSSSSSFAKVSRDRSMIWEDQMIIGERVSDTISFNPQLTIDSLEFFIVIDYRDINYCDGILGLQYDKIRHDSHTILFQLYQRDLIERNQFTFVHRNDNKGEVIIGNELPLIINNDNTVIRTKKDKGIECDVIKDDYITMWYCRSKKVTLFNEKYDKEGLVYINPSFGMIVGPYEFKRVIKKIILKDHITNDDCIEDNYKHHDNPNSFDDYYSTRNYHYFICKAEARITIPDDFKLSFYFDNNNNSTNHLDILGEDLFVQINSTHKMFTILVNLDTRYIKILSWIIGEQLLKKYDVVFRNDQNIIQFNKPISNKHNTVPKSKNNNSRFIIICSILICSFLLLLVLYFIKRKLSKHSKSALFNDKIDTLHCNIIQSKD